MVIKVDVDDAEHGSIDQSIDDDEYIIGLIAS